MFWWKVISLIFYNLGTISTQNNVNQNLVKKYFIELYNQALARAMKEQDMAFERKTDFVPYNNFEAYHDEEKLKKKPEVLDQHSGWTHPPHHKHKHHTHHHQHTNQHKHAHQHQHQQNHDHKHSAKHKHVHKHEHHHEHNHHHKHKADHEHDEKHKHSHKHIHSHKVI